MLRKILLPCAALSLLLAASCGPSLLHVREKSVAEAELLKAEVVAAGIESEEITVADRYLAMAKEGAKLDNVQFADYSASIYSAALARHTLNVSAEAVAAAEAALRDSEEKVKKYEQILTEISSGKEAN